MPSVAEIDARCTRESGHLERVDYVEGSVARAHTRTIDELSLADIGPGRLAECFQNGALAVRIGGDQRIEDVWASLVDLESAADLSHPTRWNLFDMARNHSPGNNQLGDMIRVVPGHYASIIRKFRIYQSPEKGGLRTTPETFWNRTEWTEIPPRVLVNTWDLMSALLTGMLPDGVLLPNHAVDVQIVKYITSPAELDRLSGLLSDSAGRYARIGHDVDRFRAEAAGPLGLKGIRTLFGLGCLSPSLRPQLRRLNGWLLPRSEKATLPTSQIVGIPHFDGPELFVALSSQRDQLVTEVLDGSNWVELPLSASSVSLFAAKNETSRQLGIVPTRHRVLVDSARPIEDYSDSANVTLRLAIVDLQDSLNIDYVPYGG